MAGADGLAFEDLAGEALPVSDLGMLLAPFVDDCHRSKTDLERLRCEMVRTSLRAHLPGRTFSTTREGTDAVLLAPFDPIARSVGLTVAGCLACKELVDAGWGERRYLTLMKPSRGPSGGPVAAAIARGRVVLANATLAAEWAKSAPSFVTEILFRPADEPWTVGSSRGYAFKLVGVRVYNRCTGEVMISEPPSRAAAPKEDPCDRGDAGAQPPAKE